jgi:hypothetical protein
VTVPPGATIESAYIQFTVDEVSAGAASLAIAVEAGAAAPFAGQGAVSGRALSAETVAWAPPEWPTVGAAGEAQRTPDLAALVAAAVGSPGWEAGDALGFVITGSGARIAESYDGSSVSAPVLHVTWSTVAPGTNTAPRVTATGTNGLAGTDSVLTAEIVDDGLPNPPGAVTVSWTQTAGPATTIDDPTAAVTSALLPEPGEYTFVVTVSDSERSASATVTVVGFDPTASTQAVFPVVSGADDVEEYPDGELYVDSSDLELVEEFGESQTGLRFAGVTVPPGATIESAYIQFTVDEYSTAPTALSIGAVDAVDADPFVGSGAVTSAPVLGETVAWAPAAWQAPGLAGAAQATPDLGPLVGAIVARPGWASGNALAFVISGSGTRVAESYDASPLAAPVLVIEYIPAG